MLYGYKLPPFHGLACFNNYRNNNLYPQLTQVCVYIHLFVAPYKKVPFSLLRGKMKKLIENHNLYEHVFAIPYKTKNTA